MALMDILNELQAGSSGQPAAAGEASGSGLSPVMLALLGLVAGKAVGAGQPQAATGGEAPTGGLLGGLLGMGGGLEGLMKGGLGGLLSGESGASALGTGLSDLIRQFEQAGHGETVNSWIGTGTNQSIAPTDLAKVIGSDKIDALAAQSGLSGQELLASLSQHLPEFINKLTPSGQLPGNG
ncbi:MAG: DUF937 domain-containing protein [Proteobacteria bacterium]|nr:DUF937 domain-containing protein [Pseudomonadota bacterium]